MAPLLPTLAAGARTLLSRAINSPNDLAVRSPSFRSELGPLAARSFLLARDNTDADKNGEQKVDPSRGVVDPHDINSNFLFALFGLIGVAFVVTGIWFFFWAKNGGFYFKEDDWDDYKSTVLRRKGPNGTILSNATKSTKLGGGSVYKDYDDVSTEYTGAQTHSRLAPTTADTASTLSGITAGASDLAAREKRAKKREKREREKEKKKDRRSRKGGHKGEDGVLVDEEAEAEAQHAVRRYRHERPARVGGLNKESEGSTWDGSTNPDSSTNAGSELLSHRQSTPTNSPTKEKEKERESGSSKKKSGGIRKVYSTADRNRSREDSRIRAEARRLQEKGRAAGRRDFSYQRAESSVAGSSLVSGSSHTGGTSEVASSYLPGSWQDGDEASDLGTKSYRHFIPGLSSVASESELTSSAAGGTDVIDYADDKRKKRGNAYRRD